NEIHAAVAVDIDRRHGKPAIPFAEIDRPPSARRVFGKENRVAAMRAAGEIGENDLLIAALWIETPDTECRRRKTAIVPAHRKRRRALRMDREHGKTV